MSSTLTSRSAELKGVAELEIVEGDAERMPLGIALPAAPHPTPAERGDGVGGALHGGALHVVQHAANAAQFLAPAGASRAAMHQRRERRAVTGRFLGAAGIRPRECGHGTGRDPSTRRAASASSAENHRGREAPAAAARERDRIGRVAGRARRSPPARTPPPRAPRAPRAGRGTAAAAAGRTRRAAHRHPRPRSPRSRPTMTSHSRSSSPSARKHVRALRKAHQRTHADALAPADRPRQPCRGRPRAPRAIASTNSGAGTSALRMAVHFCPAFTVISRTTSRMNRSNSALPGAASAPRMLELSESVSATNGTEWRTTRGCARSFAAVVAEPVKQTMSWQVRWSNRFAETAAHELQRALGQDAGLDDTPHDKLGEIGGRRRRLHDHGNAREHRRRQLLEHAPDRKIERVDVHGGAFARHIDMLADEAARSWTVPRRRHRDTGGVCELPRTLAREAEYRAYAAVDVDPGVVLGGAGAIRQRVELFLATPRAVWQSPSTSRPARESSSSAAPDLPPRVHGRVWPRSRVHARRPAR